MVQDRVGCHQGINLKCSYLYPSYILVILRSFAVVICLLRKSLFHLVIKHLIIALLKDKICQVRRGGRRIMSQVYFLTEFVHEVSKLIC